MNTLKKIKRKTFIKNLSIITLSSLFLKSVQGEEKKEEIDLMVVKGQNPQELIKIAIDGLGGIEKFVKKGDKVILKPNMSFPYPPSSGANTHPEVVVAVAQLCLEAGAKKILVIDHPLGDMTTTIEKSGIGPACSKIKGINILSLIEKEFYKKVKVPQGKELKEVEVVQEILEASVLINLPTAKSHNATTVSLGMKNLLGLVFDRNYFHKMIELNQGIADLSTLIKPHLIIVDATRALITNGPSGPGEIKLLKTIVAGKDPVATDAYAVTLTKWHRRNYRPEEIKHILLASKLGLGEINFVNLKIKKVEI